MDSPLDFTDLDGAEWVDALREYYAGMMQLMEKNMTAETEDTWKHKLLHRIYKDALSELNIYDNLYGSDGNYAWLQKLVDKVRNDTLALETKEE